MSAHDIDYKALGKGVRLPLQDKVLKILGSVFAFSVALTIFTMTLIAGGLQIPRTNEAQQRQPIHSSRKQAYEQEISDGR